jgi:hypothetical protein
MNPPSACEGINQMADATDKSITPDRVAVIPIYEPMLERALQLLEAVRRELRWICSRPLPKQCFSSIIQRRCVLRTGRGTFSQTRVSRAVMTGLIRPSIVLTFVKGSSVA